MYVWWAAKLGAASQLTSTRMPHHKQKQRMRHLAYVLRIAAPKVKLADKEVPAQQLRGPGSSLRGGQQLQQQLIRARVVHQRLLQDGYLLFRHTALHALVTPAAHPARGMETPLALECKPLFACTPAADVYLPACLQHSHPVYQLDLCYHGQHTDSTGATRSTA